MNTFEHVEFFILIMNILQFHHQHIGLSVAMYFVRYLFVKCFSNICIYSIINTVYDLPRNLREHFTIFGKALNFLFVRNPSRLRTNSKGENSRNFGRMKSIHRVYFGYIHRLTHANVSRIRPTKSPFIRNGDLICHFSHQMRSNKRLECFPKV